MKQPVLLRQGLSQGNSESRFTGWVDAPLRPQSEARAAGSLLRTESFVSERAHTSLLERAIKPRSSRSKSPLRSAKLAPSDIPTTERLKVTVARFSPFWESDTAAARKRGERVTSAPHRRSLRGRVEPLDEVTDADIVELDTPRACELDDALEPIEPRPYLVDAVAAEAAAKAVANQIKGK